MIAEPSPLSAALSLCSATCCRYASEKVFWGANSALNPLTLCWNSLGCLRPPAHFAQCPYPAPFPRLHPRPFLPEAQSVLPDATPERCRRLRAGHPGCRSATLRMGEGKSGGRGSSDYCYAREPLNSTTLLPSSSLKYSWLETDQSALQKRRIGKVIWGVLLDRPLLPNYLEGKRNGIRPDF